MAMVELSRVCRSAPPRGVAGVRRIAGELGGRVRRFGRSGRLPAVRDGGVVRSPVIAVVGGPPWLGVGRSRVRGANQPDGSRRCCATAQSRVANDAWDRVGDDSRPGLPDLQRHGFRAESMGEPAGSARAALAYLRGVTRAQPMRRWRPCWACRGQTASPT